MLNKVKDLLSGEATKSEDIQENPQEEVKLEQQSLVNGTILEAESFESGKEVFIVTEDEKVALPVGEYTLEDGEILKVEEEGIIASIGAAEEPAEEEASKEENLEEEKEEMQYATKEELAEVKEMIEEIKGMIEKKDEMSVEEPQPETKEDLSAVEEPVEKIKHNPEKETKKVMNLYAQKRTQTTYDRVLSKIANFKNK